MQPFSITEAAVATIISQDPVPGVLVLKRRANPRDPWSGHYSFPGGRRDDTHRCSLEPLAIHSGHLRNIREGSQRTAIGHASLR